MPLSLDCDILIVIVNMAPPSTIDFPKKVSVKTEIKPHPFLATVDESTSCSPPTPEIKHEIAVSPIKEPPPIPCFQSTEGPTANESFEIPAAVVRQPPYVLPKLPSPVACDACPLPSIEPKPFMDDTEYQMGALLSIFLLGIVSGASIVYAFTKPVVVHAATLL